MTGGYTSLTLKVCVGPLRITGLSDSEEGSRGVLGVLPPWTSIVTEVQT